MQTNRLKIVGLGRCIIGHMANYLNEYHSDSVTFKHHYLLNYNTCLNSNISKELFEKIKNAKSMPTFNDQLNCLNEVQFYDICAIEIFPPAQLFKHTTENVLVCFEDFTKELEQLGFQKDTYIEDNYKKNYILTIEKLVNKIKSLNKNIKIILVNGEIVAHPESPKIGSPNLLNLLIQTKNSEALQDTSVNILDMNSVISDLEKKHKTFFEIAFPHLYIRHSHDIVPIEFARDCKHATPTVRKYFLKSFCNIIKNYEFNVPEIMIEEKVISFAADTFQKRAEKFMLNHNKETFLVELEDSKLFSLFISYCIELSKQEHTNFIHNYMQLLSEKELTSMSLKTYFYHIRSLCAYEFVVKDSDINYLLQIGINLIYLPKEELFNASNFAILWLKNIYLALLENPNINSEKLTLFAEGLENHEYLGTFYEIQLISKQLKKLL